MAAASDPEFYGLVIRRIGWIALCLGAGGALVLLPWKGPGVALGFLVGSAVSYLSFWRWQRVVSALSSGPGAASPARRSAWPMALRILAVGAAAYCIIKFLGFNLAAALAGLLVSAAAVVVEILYELIYAGT